MVRMVWIVCIHCLACLAVLADQFHTQESLMTLFLGSDMLAAMDLCSLLSNASHSGSQPRRCPIEQRTTAACMSTHSLQSTHLACMSLRCPTPGAQAHKTSSLSVRSTRGLLVLYAQVDRGQSAVMQHLSLLEVGGIRLLLYINHSAVRRLLARSASFGDFPGS